MQEASQAASKGGGVQTQTAEGGLPEPPGAFNIMFLPAGRPAHDKHPARRGEAMHPVPSQQQ